MEIALVKFGVMFLVFAAVIALAAWRSEKVSVRPRLALPLLALVVAALNAATYWLLAPLVALVAPPIVGWIVAPLVLNAALLLAADRLLRPVEVRGLLPLTALLAAAHLAVNLGFHIAL